MKQTNQPKKVGKDLEEKEFKKICSQLFDRVNEKCFANKLPKYRFIINRRLKTTAAQVLFPEKIIEISLNYHHRYPEDLEDTIKHEMIHIFLRRNKKNSNHFKDFKRIASKMSVSVYAN